MTATSLDGVAVNGSLVRFAQRRQHHDSKQPVLVVFSERQQQQQDEDDDDTGLSVHTATLASSCQHCRVQLNKTSQQY